MALQSRVRRRHVNGESGAPVVDVGGRVFGLLNGQSASSQISVVIVVDVAMDITNGGNSVKLSTAIQEERWALVCPFH